jgi:hypothetical protein
MAQVTSIRAVEQKSNSPLGPTRRYRHLIECLGGYAVDSLGSVSVAPCSVICGLEE